MALLLLATGTKMNHVPFSGGSGQLTVALVGNTVPVGFDTMTTAMPQVRGGTLRALGISSRARSPAGARHPGHLRNRARLRDRAWNAMLAPAGTPQPIIDKLSAAIGRILRSPEVSDAPDELGATPVGSSRPSSRTSSRAKPRNSARPCASIGVTPQ